MHTSRTYDRQLVISVRGWDLAGKLMRNHKSGDNWRALAAFSSPFFWRLWRFTKSKRYRQSLCFPSLQSVAPTSAARCTEKIMNIIQVQVLDLIQQMLIYFKRIFHLADVTFYIILKTHIVCFNGKIIKDSLFLFFNVSFFSVYAPFLAFLPTAEWVNYA